MQRKVLRWLEAKVDSEARTIEGYASTFEDESSPDAYGDIVSRDAFNATIARNLPTGRIKIADQHGQPVGLVEAGRVDERGLWIKGRISATTQGEDVLTYCRDKVYGELSIGYVAIKSRRLPSGVRILDEVELLEVSPCAWAANPNAVITAVKAAEPEVKAVLVALEELERKASLLGSAYALMSIAEARSRVSEAVDVMAYGEGASEELVSAIKGEFDGFKKWLKGLQIGG